ncbi:hypothetical protein J5X84_34005 [Streptosporangiaceae bacterium NEAU-GS5]|nr:hypothetical protein [Streptosporangiaceae bacterium NEAU-GS5]
MAVARKGLERSLLPSIRVGLEGWHRAHSQGAGIGVEQAAGILYAPPEVNLQLQNSGIEEFIREVHQQRAPDVEVMLTTTTKAHPMTRRLAEIQYVVEAVRAGGRPEALFETSIEVSNSQLNPRVTLSPPRIRGEIERFLKPSAPRLGPTRAAGRSSARPIQGPSVENVRRPDVRATGNRATARSRSGLETNALEVSPGRRAAGAGVSILSFGIQLAAGMFAEPAIMRRAEERRDRTGYAPPSLDYFDESGSRILAAARFMASPFASDAIPEDARYDISVLRRRLKEAADQTPPGGTLSIIWDVQVGYKRDALQYLVPDILPIKIVYKKLANGRWLDVQALSDSWPENAPIKYGPNLDRIIDPSRSDKEVEIMLGNRLSPRERGLQ